MYIDGQIRTFIPHWHPVPINKLYQGHWTKRRALKKESQTIVAYKFAGMPRAEKKRRVHLHVVLGKGHRACDVDAYHKDLLDALVKCKMLIDDSPKWCEIVPIKITRDWDDWGTMIIIEDMIDG